jgi:propanol-preferring alcohol dehydrogenase
MRVIAIDGGDEKRDLCKRLGAEEFIDYTKTKDIPAEVKRITTYGAHGVLVTAATKEAYAMAPMLLRPQGTMVAVGLPQDPTVIAGAPPVLLCMRALNVVGSVVGTLVDVDEALDFTARGLVHVSRPSTLLVDPGTNTFDSPSSQRELSTTWTSIWI